MRPLEFHADELKNSKNNNMINNNIISNSSSSSSSNNTNSHQRVVESRQEENTYSTSNTMFLGAPFTNNDRNEQEEEQQNNHQHLYIREYEDEIECLYVDQNDENNEKNNRIENLLFPSSSRMPGVRHKYGNDGDDTTGDCTIKCIHAADDDDDDDDCEMEQIPFPPHDIFRPRKIVTPVNYEEEEIGGKSVGRTFEHDDNDGKYGIIPSLERASPLSSFEEYDSDDENDMHCNSSKILKMSQKGEYLISYSLNFCDQQQRDGVDGEEEGDD